MPEEKSVFIGFNEILSDVTWVVTADGNPTLKSRTALPPVEWKALTEAPDVQFDVTGPRAASVERDDGYYWILDYDGWTVGKWEKNHWSAVLGSHSDERYFDADFERIGSIIPMPDAT